MGLKDLLNKVSGSVPEEEYEYEEEGMEEEYEEQPQAATQSTFRPSRPTYGGQQANKVQMNIVEPKEYAGVEKIADALRQMRPVVINFENTDSHDAARIVDFISGAAYALDGHIEKVGKDIFLCVPNNVTLDYNDRNSFSDLPDTIVSNWKETKI